MTRTTESDVPSSDPATRRLPDRAQMVARVGALDSASRRTLTKAHNNMTTVAPSSPTPPLKLIRFPVVRERTGLSRSTIWRLERRGDFPRHYRISANVVAWVEEEIAEWIQTKANRVPA